MRSMEESAASLISIPCFSTVPGNTSCNVLDTACLCNDSEFQRLAQQCVMENCGMKDTIGKTLGHRLEKREILQWWLMTDSGGHPAIQKFGSSLCNMPPRSRKHELLIPLAIQIPAWLCIWARLYSRWLIMGRWGPDDWFMFIAGFIFTGFVAMDQYVGQVWYGVDIWTLDEDQITKAFKLSYAGESIYLLSLGLSKICVLWVYLRNFPNQLFRYAVFVSMALVALPTAGLVFLHLFQCNPVHLVWDGWTGSTGARELCVDKQLINYIAAGFSIFQDVLILLLPIPLVLKLRMHINDKWGILCMFTLGAFITASSVVRLQYLITVGRSRNPTWDYVDAIIWTGVEVSVVVMVACLPAVGVLLRHWIPSLAVNTSDGYRRNDLVSASHMMRRNLTRRSDKKRSIISASRRLTWESLGLDLGDRSFGRVMTKVSRHPPSFHPFNDSYFDGPDQGISIRAVTKVTTSVEVLK
ncbi:unnamed protein product [Clonostachys rosea]|uniref:Extracellular membrane protein CFEM domain-containing protein n=1 Tax=Bionectria ochroleuca TaxID=29856 RepID=A0ABY6UI20_BIOOC|nr:unnamed protein product [Clonostachys rosea]